MIQTDRRMNIDIKELFKSDQSTQRGSMPQLNAAKQHLQITISPSNSPISATNGDLFSYRDP